MKCKNPRVDEDMVLFDCPFCDMDAEVDEATLAAIWAQDTEGKLACPPPEGCGKEYILPTMIEVSNLRTKPESDSTAPAQTTSAESAAIPPSSSDLEKEIEDTAKELADSIKEGNDQHAPPGKSAHAQPPANGMQMAIRTFRHGDWQGGGQDNFDDEVSRFLEDTGMGNVVSVTPMTYTDKDDKMTDYGVMIVFKRPATAAEPGM